MAHGLHYYTSLRITDSHCRPDLPKRLVPCLHRAFHSRLPLSLRVPTVLLYRSTGISTCCPSATTLVLALGPDLPRYRSTGISTCCPSATTLVLALGPDLPRADQLYSGNLGYSAIRILTLFSLLIPAFSLPCSPLLLSVQLRSACNAPLPMYHYIP